ncbi:hypothetical protein R1sor_001894 [Riccia sorocarpa]|uniref:Uncharacterized protein n=1 Tax=Riccia sorocarpa TaxID=122646 RepID=A0ABD3H0C6_9MARC
MNASDFSDNEVLGELKEVWNKHPEGMTDTRGKWLLVWKRVKHALVKRDKEKKRKSSPLKELQLELCQLRERIQSQDDQALRDELVLKELECRKKEAIESQNWRKRSRIRWLTNGDAPSRYFYSQLRAKQVKTVIEEEVGLVLAGNLTKTSEREGLEDKEELTATDESRTDNSVISKAQKTLRTSLAVRDSQKREGTWRRVSGRSNPHGQDDPDK